MVRGTVRSGGSMGCEELRTVVNSWLGRSVLGNTHADPSMYGFDDRCAGFNIMGLYSSMGAICDLGSCHITRWIRSSAQFDSRRARGFN